MGHQKMDVKCENLFLFSKLCSPNQVMGGRRTHSVSALLLVAVLPGRGGGTSHPQCLRTASCFSIIGVVQMVNKLNGTFTKADEESFETFAIYCGLALHHAKVRNTLHCTTIQSQSFFQMGDRTNGNNRFKAK